MSANEVFPLREALQVDLNTKKKERKDLNTIVMQRKTVSHTQLSNTWSQINVIVGFDIIISFKEFKSCFEVSQPIRTRQGIRNAEGKTKNKGRDQDFTFYMEVVYILLPHQEAQNLYTFLSLPQAQPSSLHLLTVQSQI